jgi:hypothetical protein
MEIEELPVRDYTDSELSQQYSLTFKIANYYRGELTQGQKGSPYAQLLAYAEKDITALLKEFQRRGISVPTVETSTETVSTTAEGDSETTEKNDSAAENEEDLNELAENGEVSYETPVIVHKLSSDADSQP